MFLENTLLAPEESQLFFESNPQPMWVFDPDTFAFLAVNEAAVRLYGYSREEFLARTIPHCWKKYQKMTSPIVKKRGGIRKKTEQSLTLRSWVAKSSLKQGARVLCSLRTSQNV